MLLASFADQVQMIVVLPAQPMAADLALAALVHLALAEHNITIETLLDPKVKLAHFLQIFLEEYLGVLLEEAGVVQHLRDVELLVEEQRLLLVEQLLAGHIKPVVAEGLLRRLNARQYKRVDTVQTDFVLGLQNEASFAARVIFQLLPRQRESFGRFNIASLQQIVV